MSTLQQLSSNKQAKKSLSGKKIPLKGLRNVLAQPYDFFWPIVRNDDDGKLEELKILLKESMPALKRPSICIPWSRLHKLNKNERRIARDEARAKLDSSIPDENILNSVVTGVNGVTRLLEKNDAACVLLEANVEPMLLVKHIVTMAELKNVSIILVDYLKTVMLETVGFASAAVALKKTVAGLENHHFYKLYKKIVELSNDIGGKKKPLKFDYEQSVSDDNCSIVEKISTVNAAEFFDKESDERSDNLFTLSSDVYLYRNSRKERIFLPETTKSDIDNDSFNVDFISIGNDPDFTIDDNKTLAKNKRKIRYMNINESKEDKQKLRGIKIDRSQPDEYISLDPNPNPFLASLSNDESNIDDDVSYERGTKILGMSEKNSSNLNSKKSFKRKKKNFNENIEYKSLKVKRIQGNVKRIKATKNPKRKKK